MAWRLEVLAASIYFLSSRIDYGLKRGDIARQELEAYITLSESVYRHFLLETDAMLSGKPDAEIEVSRVKLDNAIQSLKTITKQETIFIEDDDEAEIEADEFDRVAGLELEVHKAYAAVDTIKQHFNRGDRSEGRRLLLALRKDQVDGKLAAAIAAAIEDEAEEVLEADREAQELLEKLSLMARVTAIFALLATVALIVVFTRRVGDPVSQLVERIQQVARGDLSHRLDIVGKGELTEVAKQFDVMVAKLEERETELRSARTDLEIKVEDRTHELDAANKALQHTDQLRQRFLADISHELRTPITAIQGEAEVALRGRVKEIPEYKQALKHINHATLGLGRLVSDLLFMARTSAGEVRITRKAIELTSLLETIREEALVLGKDKDIRIAFRRVEGAAIVLGDRPRLRQLFYILIENAIRYSDHEVHITLDVVPREHWIQTRVCDNGIGMSAMDLENAFDRFYRGDGAQQILSDGSGLGLPVAKSIVEAHKGEIFIESTPGRGTTVTVNLPAAEKIRSAA